MWIEICRFILIKFKFTCVHLHVYYQNISLVVVTRLICYIAKLVGNLVQVIIAG